MDRTAAAKIRSSIRCLIAGTAALCAFAAAWPALAQTPGTAGPISLGDLFMGPDVVTLKPGADNAFKDAARKALATWDALAPGRCPKPRLTVTVLKGDDLFQQALAAARRDALLALLSFSDAQKFLYVEDIAGSSSNVEIDASVADTAPPTITVDPPSRTKVSNGQRLTITVTATEPSTGWQSGVKQITIEDLDRHDNLEPWDNLAPAPRPCGDAGLTQTITRSTYTVPPDVPVARLKITARDYHNSQELTVEYPTGDWTGTFTYEGVSVAAVRSRASADIVLNHDGKGNLRGTMVGQHQVPAGTSNNCSWMPSQPNRFRVSLVGSYTEGRSFKVFIDEVVEDTGIKYMLQCSGIPIPVALDRAFDPYTWGYKAFLGTPSPLGEGEVTADGVRQYKLDSAPGPAWTVTLRPARN